MVRKPPKPRPRVGTFRVTMPNIISTWTGASAGVPGGGGGGAPNVLFFHDAESTPIADSGDPGDSYTFNDVQSRVARSTTVAKNGTYSLYHPVTAPDDDSGDGSAQVGKVRKTYAPWTGMTGSQALEDQGYGYFSNWFYFPTSGNKLAESSSGGGTGGNWELFNNHFEWKADNNTIAPANIQARAGAKIIVAAKWYQPDGAPGNFYWMLDISEEKYIESPGSFLDCLFPLDYFSGTTNPLSGGVAQKGKYILTGFDVPFDEWVFLEMYLKMGQTDGAIKIWSGTQSSGLLLLIDIADPLLNTLTMRNDADDAWSSNTGMYHTCGNYMRVSSPREAGDYLMYTDDYRISDGPIGPTLPEFS